MKFLTFSIISLSVLFSFGQACTTTDSLNNHSYHVAIDYLTDQNESYLDSIRIDSTLRARINSALTAFHSNQQLFGYDTIVNVLKPTTYDTENNTLFSIEISDNQNSQWFQNLNNGILPTGSQYLDSIIQEYNLFIDSTYTNSFNTTFTVLTNPTPLNMSAIVRLLNQNGYESRLANYLIGIDEIQQGIAIEIIDDENMKLIFQVQCCYLCENCSGRRYWEYLIDSDCNISFNLALSTSSISGQNISVYPTPSSDIVNVRGVDNIRIEILDLKGQKVLTSNKKNLSIKNLSNGTYLLNIYQNNQLLSTKKIIKN